MPPERPSHSEAIDYMNSKFTHYNTYLLVCENRWELMRIMRILMNCVTAEFQNFFHLLHFCED